VDLLVDDRGEQAVVEVRSARRRDGDEYLYTASKERQVRRAAAGLDPPVFRIDLVTVLFAEDGITLRWARRV